MRAGGKRSGLELVPAGILVALLVLALVPAVSADEAGDKECVAAGLAKPTVTKPVVMHHAGIRPLTPGRYFSQGTDATFLFQALPEGCAAVTRSIGSMLQMQQRSDRQDWINAGAKNGVAEQPSNGERYVNFNAAPNHAWPDYMFNECVGGKGWLKVRAVLTLRVKSGDTHQLLGEQSFVFPGKVYGSCRAARASAKATENYQEEWGDGSGSRRGRAADSQSMCVAAVLAKPQLDAATVDDAGRHPYEHSRRSAAISRSRRISCHLPG